MKQLFSNSFYLAFFLIFATSITAQTSDRLWNKKMDSEINHSSKIERRTIPNEFDVYSLDVNELKQKLQNSPKRKGKSVKSSTILSFPTAYGTLEKYEVFEASILDESLQKKFPTIKSYIGKNIDNPSSVVRFSISKIGVHAMIMGGKEGAVYIDPYTSNKESYIIYSKKNVPKTDSFQCLVEEIGLEQKAITNNLEAKSENADDGQLRTFRLAIATTGEYSQFQLVYNGISANATTEEKKEAVLAAINVTMTRVNGIFERDVSLTMELVANNADIIFLDPDTDPFTNNDGNILIDESQTTIDTNIGLSNYDIGHTFSTGGGGLAQLRSPCTTGKARGVTGSSFPIGDAYDIDYVAHEMGHQYGANHTFNSSEGNCGGGTRNDLTAIEPGSGSTIMGYAGLCAPDNVQSQGDDYFHLVSIKEMWENITNGSSNCGVETDSGNSPPTVDALVNYTLPISTPFVLNAKATDNVGDELTYTWEQLDNEIAPSPPLVTSTGGAAFRSVSPTTSAMRYFPNQNTVLNGDLSNTWEVLPSVERTMKFGVNVRDNNLNGGQTASQETILTFDATSGPFKVTSQNSFVSWNSETTQTITWDVANTSNAPVSCSEVNILLSPDGGYTFPVTLASNVSNNGSASIVVPNITTNNGRIKIESVNNIFYDVNDSNINIQAKEFSLNIVDNSDEVCKPEDAVYNFTYNTYLGFNEVTGFSVVGNPTGTTVAFNPATASANGTTVEMTISGIGNATIGAYDMMVVGTSDVSSLEKQEPITLDIFDAIISAPILTSPVNNAIEIFKPYLLEWSADENVKLYEVQIATDNSFSTIVEQSNSIAINSYSPQLLNTNTVYYWRVKAVNNCGESSFSSSFNFATANEVCDNYNASDTPLSIPDNDPGGVTSEIYVIDNKLISEVNVTVNITHTYVSDLAITLISPSGISILLSVNNGGSGKNYTNTIFDDNASVKISDGSAPFSGTYNPQIPLSYLNSTESQGNWTLKVVDSGVADIGTIENWSIEVCGISTASKDDDGDGVPNELDQCPDTPLGTTVNEIGCFALVSDNFEINTTSETCPSMNNGTITVSAIEAYTYNTVVNGVAYSFSNTNDLFVENLAPGSYDFCITVEGEDGYQQCFNAVIEEGAIIAGKANVESDKVSIDIFEGTPPFIVLLNGKTVLNTSVPTFSINVNHGDYVEVRTAIDCEGLFLKNIELFDEIIAYPNPTSGIVNLTLPFVKKEVVIEIYNVQSQLISSKRYPVISGKVQLNIEDVSTGVYIVKVLLERPVGLKIVKH